MESDNKKTSGKDPRQDEWITNTAIHRLENLGYIVIPPAGKRNNAKKPVEEMTQEEMIAEIEKSKAVKKRTGNKYLKEHPEKRREYQNRYAKNHPEKIREYSKRAYEKKKARERAIKERLQAIENGKETVVPLTENFSVIMKDGDNV